ncbi:MAG: hypothetical protein Q7R93_03490 [bacterium]|nr:hypothetical protein [bacterium]
MKSNIPFEELSVDFTHTTVFLDVDGTLAPDGSLEFSSEVLQKVRELSGKNQVLLCTNKRDPVRFAKLEALFSLPVVTKRHKKPSRRVLDEAGAIAGERVVIGDKFLTDELFAKRIKARFIRTRRKLSGNEVFSVKVANVVDDITWTLYQKLFS